MKTLSPEMKKLLLDVLAYTADSTEGMTSDDVGFGKKGEEATDAVLRLEKALKAAEVL